MNWPTKVNPDVRESLVFSLKTSLWSFAVVIVVPPPVGETTGSSTAGRSLITGCSMTKPLARRSASR